MASRRWLIAGLMFIGILITYLDRANISHTIGIMSAEFNLSPQQQGFVLSAFAWGYVLFMMPGGWLVDRLGARIMNTLSCILWSLATGMIAFADGFAALVILRFILGAGEAPIFPGNAKVVRNLFPVGERGKATAIFDVGSYVGMALAAPVVVLSMVAWGWRASFVACASLGFLWSLVWYKEYGVSIEGVGGAEPQDHIGPANRAMTSQGTEVGFVGLLAFKTIWGMSLGFFCYNFLKSFYLTWLPSYLVMERSYSVLSVGYYAVIPPVCGICGELGAGYLTDVLIQRGVSVTVARKVPLCVCLALSSLVVVGAYVDASAWSLVFLSLSYGLLIAASPNI
jgi:MFS transporter, ACS family, D-galactonate transporter